MKAVLAAVALLLLTSPAHAFLNHVANNTALAALRSSVYPFVMRDGYTTAGDGGGMLYYPSNSACPLNSGNGDNGSEVKSSDSKCWLAVFPATGVDVLAFGADATAAATSDTAFSAAIDVAVKRGLPLRVGPGTFKFSAQVAYTFPTATSKLVMRGAGQENTFLKWTAGSGGIKLTWADITNSVDIADLSVITSTTNGGDALNFTQTTGNLSPGLGPESTLERLTIRGSDGFDATNYWSNCIHITGPSVFTVSSVNCDGAGSYATATGVGVSIDGGGASLIPAIYNFRALNFNGLSTGITLGAYTQGINVIQSNFVRVATGIYATSGDNTDELVVADSHFNFSAFGVRSNTADLLVHHNYFIFSANNAIGVYVTASNGFTVDHNIFRNGGAFTGTVGDRVDAELTGGVIEGNTYDNIASPHVYVVAGTFADHVTHNQYVNGSGASTIGAGIKVLLDTPYGTAFLPGVNPACPAAYNGRTQQINDSNTVVWGANIAAGGGATVTVTCNGTNWTVSAK